MNTLEFFRRILPHDGTYCLSTIDSEGKTRNSFVASQADLQKAAAHANASVHVYHACATYTYVQGKINRKQANVFRVKSFWLDVDIREDKGYKSFEQAFAGLAKFLEDSRLPTPLTVFSGGGLHLYWPLDVELTEEEWRKYATGLKLLCSKAGFKVDPGITADSARILRTPGTINLKNGKEAKILNDVGPYSLDKFNILLFQHTKKPEDIKKSYDKDADINRIASKCRQIMQFKAGVEQSGLTWIACGRVLAQCKNADEKLWHEWSAKDDRYREEEAAKKWEESVNFNNGITCSHFKSINPEGCAGCPHVTIKSPVQLGRGPEGAIELPEQVQQDINEFELPYPYRLNAQGSIVMDYKKGEEADTEEIEISRFPFFIADRTTSSLDDTDNAIIIKHYKPADGWKEDKLSLEAYGSAPIAGLTKLGIMLTNEKHGREYIRKSYNELGAKKAMTEVHETYGWKGDKFLLGERLYYFEDGKLAYQTVHLGADARSLAKHLRPGGQHKRGSVEAWRRAAQRLFAAGHEWQGATFLVAAGAPLLALLDDVEGGTIWSLFDPVGGKGKTTATIAGATLWGSWEGLSTQAADTINARMAKLGTLCNLPLAYDEMKRDNPGIAKQFVQTFTAGSERARMNRTGVVSRSPRTWRTFMLTSANSELVGAIAADEGSEAMSDRVLEIHAENLPLRRGELDSTIKPEFLNNPGYAGPILLALILKDLDNTRARVKEKEKHYMALLNDSKLRFRAQLIAVVETIGELIVESELLVFDPSHYSNWLLNRVTDSIEQTEVFDAPEYLARYIREKQNSILYTKSFKPGASKVAGVEPKSGKVDIRVETDTQFIVIPRKDLEIWLQSKDQSMKAFIQEMQEKGILEAKNIKRTLTSGTHLTSGLEYVLIFRGNHELMSGVSNIVPMEPPTTIPSLPTPVQSVLQDLEQPAVSLRLSRLKVRS